MEELTHMVQYRRTSGTCDLGWHTIAAFDCSSAADHYRKECEGYAKQRDYEYRVREIPLNAETWGTAACR
jgi:hypothetical protein